MGVTPVLVMPLLFGCAYDIIIYSVLSGTGGGWMQPESTSSHVQIPSNGSQNPQVLYAQWVWEQILWIPRSNCKVLNYLLLLLLLNNLKL